MEVFLHIAAVFLAAAAVLPWIRQDDWWIRVFDFPRLQFLFAGIVLFAIYLAIPKGPVGYLLQWLTAAAVLHQLWRIRPYTRFARVQVQRADREADVRGNIRIIVANVYMPNRDVESLLRLVRRERPDVLLALETDEWWEAQLRPLEAEYPHAVKHPLPNTYGMLLYSKRRLLRPEVRFLVDDEVPSILTAIDMPGYPSFQLHCLHPTPPRPSKRQDSTCRDAELMIVGHQIRRSSDPVIVAGDLNDVAWSYTTLLFQRLTGMLDPRRGRGMFNTFHAQNPLLRYPLDHIFHSGHFRLVRLERLPPGGSDHFPILAELSYERNEARTRNSPEADEDDLALSREMIARAKRDART